MRFHSASAAWALAAQAGICWSSGSMARLGSRSASRTSPCGDRERAHRAGRAGGAELRGGLGGAHDLHVDVHIARPLQLRGQPVLARLSEPLAAARRGRLHRRELQLDDDAAVTALAAQATALRYKKDPKSAPGSGVARVRPQVALRSPHFGVARFAGGTAGPNPPGAIDVTGDGVASGNTLRDPPACPKCRKALDETTLQQLRAIDIGPAAATAIDVQRLPFAEFQHLAEDANYMVEKRTETEQALKLSERRFQLALDAAQNHLWDLDLTTGYVTVSDSFFRMLGYEPPID